MKKTRLPIITALVIALLMAVQFVVSYTRETRSIEESMENEMDDAREACLYYMLNVYDAAEEMVRLSLSSLDSPDNMYNLADHVLGKYDDVSSCYISFDPDFFPEKGRLYAPCAYWQGDTVIVHSQFGDSIDYTERDWYKGALVSDADGFWSTAYIDPDWHKPVITHAVKVLFPSGEVIGVVGVDVEAEWLKLALESSRPYKNSTSRLYNADGALLMSVGPEVTNESPDKHFVLESSLMAMDIKLVISVPKSTIWRHIGWTSLLTFIFLVGSILLLGWLVMRFMRNQKELAKAETEQEVMRKEMQIAHTIQMGMLPSPHLEQDGVSIYGSLVPAREVGGDIYDYFIRDGKLFFCIGDVSGKGASSAMLMSFTHALFRSASAHESNPARIMQSINETACQGNKANMFVTFFIGVLDLPSGHLRYCSAGHDSPIIMEEGGLRDVQCKPHLPLGVFDDVKYGVQETRIDSGSTIFLYTDGLTEAKNMQRKQFGLSRVEDVLKDCDRSNPEGVLDAMNASVRAFVGEAEQSDDLTMLCIHYVPRLFDATLAGTFVMKNNLSEIPCLGNFMKETTDKLGLDKTLSKQLRLAVEEAVVNVVDYAYPADSEGEIQIQISSAGDALQVQIADSGIPFDPTARELADTSLPAEDRQIGGLGILLFRALTDTINYERVDGRNILTMILKLNK